MICNSCGLLSDRDDVCMNPICELYLTKPTYKPVSEKERVGFWLDCLGNLVIGWFPSVGNFHYATVREGGFTVFDRSSAIYPEKLTEVDFKTGIEKYKDLVSNKKLTKNLNDQLKFAERSLESAYEKIECLETQLNDNMNTIKMLESENTRLKKLVKVK